MKQRSNNIYLKEYIYIEGSIKKKTNARKANSIGTKSNRHSTNREEIISAGDFFSRYCSKTKFVIPSDAPS